MSEVFNDPLMEEFDATHITPEDLNSGGGGLSEAGWAHFMVEDVTAYAEDGKLPNIRFQCHCLAHVHPSQVDKILWHRIFRKSWDDKMARTMKEPSDDARKINLRFARGLKLIQDSDLGKKVAVNWGLAKGRQFCTNIAAQQKTDMVTGKALAGQFEYRIDYGKIFPPDHEECASCPKDPEALAMYNAGGGTGGDLDDV